MKKIPPKIPEILKSSGGSSCGGAGSSRPKNPEFRISAQFPPPLLASQLNWLAIKEI